MVSEPRRGELWWANLPPPEGSEPGFTRPVLVLSADAFNRSAIKTVVAVVVTSNLRLAAAPGNVFLAEAETGLSKDSVANVSQIVTLDKAFLGERIGMLPSGVLEQVERGVKLVLGF